MTTKPFGQQRPVVSNESRPIMSPLGLSSVPGTLGWGDPGPSDLDAWERKQEILYPGIEFARWRYDLNDPESGWQVVTDG